MRAHTGPLGRIFASVLTAGACAGCAGTGLDDGGSDRAGAGAFAGSRTGGYGTDARGTVGAGAGTGMPGRGGDTGGTGGTITAR